MWHEARKQSKACEKVMADMKKRSDLRSQYLKAINKDPLSLLRIHGKSCKRFIPNQSNSSLDELYLVPWSEDPNVLIDRYDARALLDKTSIPMKRDRVNKGSNFLTRLVPEEEFLKKLASDLKFMKKKRSQSGAAVGYTYAEAESVEAPEEQEEESLDNILEKLGVDFGDTEMKINLESFSDLQKSRIDDIATHYGIMGNSFLSNLYQEQKNLQNDQNFDTFHQFSAAKPAQTKLQTGDGDMKRKYKYDGSSSDEEQPSKIEFITEFSSETSTSSKTENQREKADQTNYAALQYSPHKTTGHDFCRNLDTSHVKPLHPGSKKDDSSKVSFYFTKKKLSKLYRENVEEYHRRIGNCVADTFKYEMC
ncbi:CLK4-associating serine/arginine rich protein [Thelohanellus kitauei]|uniref:CLK4-associating serine/arginine rich protein n=1 Tax=Thelohanellus kitauei TaxID=669202 RepID=A0A0C2IX14_THEKT|nr:CLK4-associating serine/arginine rich protein [Thelohanellus kitauei]